MTKEQKLSDFQQLVGLYDKQYAPYEFNRDVLGFDMLKIQPWVDQINQSKTDLDFLDICTRYVASLQDFHDEFTILSNYDAWLHMDADLYDGKVIIDYIDRNYLPRKTYGFTTGDEIVSVDGVAVADLIKKFAPYAVNGRGNDVSTARLAVAYITDRYQSWYPLAPVSSPNAMVIIRSATDGSTASYSIPWDVTGTPVTSVGTVPNPQSAKAKQAVRRRMLSLRKGLEPADGAEVVNPWVTVTLPPDPVTPDAPQPDYMKPLVDLGHGEALADPAISGSGLSPYGQTFPLFDPPADFQIRLGAKSSDFFVSGTYKVGKSTVGLIRIPTFSPTNTTTALNQFLTEVLYFQQSTDGLVVDVMSNGGGSICYTQSIASILTPFTFRGSAFQLRANLTWQRSFAGSVASAKSLGAAQWIIDLYSNYLKEVQQALAENRGLTGSLPLCGASFDQGPPTFVATGLPASYSKPILLLTDNFTGSAAELFSMFLQDNQRATVFGMRTSGGGGNVVSYNATSYSEGNARVTQSLSTRLNPVTTPGFPTTSYFQRVGIYPDVIQDFMTLDNLNNAGATFVNAFNSTLADLIAKSKQ